jgi:CheY-like chemotaxis protein
MSELAAFLPTSPTGRAMVRLEHVPTQLLYVEDDEDLRDMIAMAFSEAGFEVTAVSSAEDALARMDAAHFDAVVTDYNLTGETAAWLLEAAAARGHLAQTAVIVLTAEQQPAGVEGFRVLRKPADFGLLLAALGDAMEKLLRADVVHLGASLPTELDLVLYVTSTSQDSHKAIRNVHRALRPYDASRYRLAIVDVAHGGDEAWYQGLEEDRVIVTPTLVKKVPAPKVWLIGTLSPAETLERLLESVLGPATRARS